MVHCLPSSRWTGLHCWKRRDRGRILNETYDVVIAGAGIAGASLAAALAPGRRVLLLEREERPGMHATGRSAAMFHLTYGGPVLQALSAASLPLFETLDARWWPHPVLSPRGLLMIAGEEGQKALDAHVASGAGALTAATVEEACARFPLLRPSRLAAAAVDPSAADIDVDALQQGYLRWFAGLGGEIRTRAPVTAAAKTGGGWRLEAGGERIEAGVLVDAAGAWGDELASIAGVKPVGLAPRLRTAALIDAPAGSEGWPMVIEARETFYLKPDAGRFLLSPADETDVVPHDAAADDFALAEGAERMEELLDWSITRRPVTWAGLRTFSPDRVPCIGFDPEVPDFFWLVGQGGYGVQTAPGAAALAAALIAGDASAIPDGIVPAAYDPARLAGREAPARRTMPA